MHLIVGTDSEFQPLVDDKTRPICVTLHSPGKPEAFYIHPRASDKVKEKAREVGDEIFESPCVLFDYLNLDWRDAPKNCKNYQNFEIVIFFSFKDLEFLFKDENLYREYVLPKLSRTRRISGTHLIETDKGMFMTDSISVPYVVNLPESSNQNKKRWSKISVTLVDISAMQGNESLKNYASNVGLTMADKDTYTSKDKENMEDRYCEDPKKFKEYALGDASILQEIREKTVEFYNKIAELIGITPRTANDFWGLSTGKIVGSMLHEWISNQLNLNVSYKPDEDELYKINNLAGSEGFTNIGRLLRNKKLNYLAMVDGGRAVKERVHSVYTGVLVDIDINGCYGNGLKNQSYFVGIPTMIDKPMKLKEFVKFIKKSVPGGWCARISWKNAPFKQDLLISKTEERFTTWDWVYTGFDNEGFEIIDDGKKVYDASMALTTNSVHQALLSHDSWQVIQNYASDKDELPWLYENAIIESSALYLTKNQVSEVTDKMREGVHLVQDIDILIKGTKQWVKVDLEPLMSLLISERKKYPKADKNGNKLPENLPMNTFLKLIINTIYGVIASEFFSVPGSCVSNVIVGNNITARARTLAWCMAKGFHSAMSVTDGGVFDVNKVLKFKSKSLAIFERLHNDDFTNPNRRNFIVKIIPLFNKTICYKETLEIKQSSELDKKSWEHLKEEFRKLDIFKHDQFNFETKDIYCKLILHSKVDYRLERPDGSKEYALRGIPKSWSEAKQKKIIDPRADILFDAIEKNKPIRIDIESTQLLSLADWEVHPDKKTLLPHDTTTKTLTFYSHTPHGLRYQDLGQYKEIQQNYQRIKAEADKLIESSDPTVASFKAAQLIADIGIDD